MNEKLKEEIRQKCTYHAGPDDVSGGELAGTSGYLLSEEQFQEIFEIINREREEEREEMFKTLIESMPRDAENLSTLTGWQARETIQNFLDNFNELDN